MNPDPFVSTIDNIFWTYLGVNTLSECWLNTINNSYFPITPSPSLSISLKAFNNFSLSLFEYNCDAIYVYTTAFSLFWNYTPINYINLHGKISNSYTLTILFNVIEFIQVRLVSIMSSMLTMLLFYLMVFSQAFSLLIVSLLYYALTISVGLIL